MFVSRKKYLKLLKKCYELKTELISLKRKTFQVTTNYLLDNRITVQGTCTVLADDKDEAIENALYEPQVNKEGLPLKIRGNVQLIETIKVEEV